MTVTQNLQNLAEPVTGADHLRGVATAPVMLVEYGEFECPHCGRVYHVVRELLEEARDEVRFVFRHFARDEVHPFSERAAQAAEAAGAQGCFWEMHDFLFQRQHQLEYDDLFTHAADLGLDVERFKADLIGNSVHLPKIRSDLRSGLASGVKSTPTFFIDGIPYTGPHDLEGLLQAIRTKASIL
ncbi:MAG: thioredoxin domain-containing protein [Actinobacteria bacterium]|nr:thioredoxin domain-containing protein [Actinomycetota bacterium]